MNKIEHTHEHDDYSFKDTEKESEYGMSTERTLSYNAFLYYHYPLSVELRQGDDKKEQIYLSFEQVERFTKWFLRNYARLKKEHERLVKMMDKDGEA